MAFFAGTAGAATGVELYSTDGTTVSLVKDINPGAPSSNPTSFAIAGGKLFFNAAEATTGSELYTSDGTASGTTLVKNIETAAAGSSPYPIGDLGGKLLFSASTAALGTELWTSDGTTIGTTNLMDINSGTGTGFNNTLSDVYAKQGYNLITNSQIFNGKFYFAGDDGPTEGNCG